MAGLAATNSATPSVQPTLIRSRLEAARRDADQAQANVQELRAQVDAAETESQKRQDKVRTLNGQAQQADPTYSAKVQDTASAIPIETQERMVGLSDATLTQPLANASGINTSPGATPVINSQGQSTGRIINLSA
jgi:outer membrane receptor for monomeric catechols